MILILKIYFDITISMSPVCCHGKDKFAQTTTLTLIYFLEPILKTIKTSNFTINALQCDSCGFSFVYLFLFIRYLLKTSLFIWLQSCYFLLLNYWAFFFFMRYILHLYSENILRRLFFEDTCLLKEHKSILKLCIF